MSAPENCKEVTELPSFGTFARIPLRWVRVNIAATFSLGIHATSLLGFLYEKIASGVSLLGLSVKDPS